MFDFPVVFVDIETTGGSWRHSRVLEVAAIRFENGQVMREFHSLVNPGVPIPRFITEITGITSGDVADAPSFEQIADELADVMQGAVFVAHNVMFDYSFIKNEFTQVGSPFSARRLCTVKLSRRLYGQHKGHSLEKLIARHNIPVSARHRALDDARAILYFAQLAHEDHGVEVFTEAITHQLQAQYVPANIEHEDIRHIQNVPGVYIFEDKDGVVLYVGKSVTLKKRVISHFQDTDGREVKMAQKVHRIKTIPTGNELAALLLESKLVKELSPVYNHKLRRVSQYCMVMRRFSEAGYPVVSYEYGLPTLQEIDTIYGMYETKTKAKSWLTILVRTFDLCPKLMGLETGKGACFSYSLDKCKGACVGKEDPAAYNQRFETAFYGKKIESWPHNGAISIPLDDAGSYITINNWIITEYVDQTDSNSYSVTSQEFDIDEYKIIKNFLQRALAS